MPLRIIRNDITKMKCDAIVNTANAEPVVGPGCDAAIYKAAGHERLLQYRKEHIGRSREGRAFLTPGFDLDAKYIIHAVSPRYMDGRLGEERKLRSCYRESLAIAKSQNLKSIAFPLISTGSFGYPKEEGLRIAVDEINRFLLRNEMLIYLVVYDEKATRLGQHLYPQLEQYIDQTYVEQNRRIFEERNASSPRSRLERNDSMSRPHFEWEGSRFDSREEASEISTQMDEVLSEEFHKRSSSLQDTAKLPTLPSEERIAAPLTTPREAKPAVGGPASREASAPARGGMPEPWPESLAKPYTSTPAVGDRAAAPAGGNLEERIQHLSDTFSEYLLYLIQAKGMTNAEVYKRAIVDKKVFSKIKNNKFAHPQKITAMCLCVGARLNIDEAKDLLARAGYALSPCDKTDIVFSWFIENGIYDMIELDIQLEEFGLPCLIE